MKRIICAVLVLLMVAASFVACSNDPKKTQAQTGAQQTQQAGTGTAQTQAATLPEDLDKWGRPNVESNIPEGKKFNGETVNFVMDISRGDEFCVEAADGDIIRDAVYKRNLKVEKDLNVKLNFITLPDVNSQDFASAISNSVLTATGEYDVCAGYGYFMTSAIKTLPYANLFDIQGVSSLDLEKPWWNQSYVKDVTLAGQLYTITGDLCISATSSAGCLFFNKRLADEHLQAFGGADGLYDLVDNYQWTIDKFHEIVKDVYKDADGDGVPGEGDFYGFGSAWNGPLPCDAFQYGMDAPITRKDPDTGEMKFVYDDGKMVRVAEKLWDLNNNGKGVLFNVNQYIDREELFRQKFKAGELIFYARSLDAANYFKDMTDDFGILPMPMFNEAQRAYYTSQSDGYSALAVLFDVEEVFKRGDLVGTTIEKLCEESYREVTPNYFETVMKSKYLRTDSADRRDIAMYDYIVGGSRFDFGMVYSIAIDNPGFMLRHLIGRDNSADFASYWKSRESLIKSLYDELIVWFLDE